jgi:hypothetical protein
MREDELLIAVEEVHISPKTGSRFGPIEPNCYIDITCFLAGIEIDIEEKSDSDITGVGVSYSWNWVSRQKSKGLPPEVYLDSPSDDLANIQGENGNMYCVPGRKGADGDLICLLLQWLREVDGLRVYRRVGLTVISYYQANQRDIWSTSWDAHFGKRRRIRLV